MGDFRPGMASGKSLVLLVLGLSALVAVVTEASPLPIEDPESSFVSETEMDSEAEQADQIESLLQQSSVRYLSSRFLRKLKDAPAKYAQKYKTSTEAAKKAGKRFQKWLRRAFHIAKKVLAKKKAMRKAFRLKKRDYLKAKRAAKGFKRAMRRARAAFKKYRHENDKKMKNFLRGGSGTLGIYKKLRKLKLESVEDKQKAKYEKKVFKAAASKAEKSSLRAMRDKNSVGKAVHEESKIEHKTRVRARAYRRNFDKALKVGEEENRSKEQRVTAFLRHRVSHRERGWLRRTMKGWLKRSKKTVVKKKPAAKSKKPAAKSKKPAAKSKKPAAK